MYFVYVSNDSEAVRLLEEVLQRIDRSKNLLAVPNGFELIQFLQNVKRGDAYPEVIILSTQLSRLNGTELLELLKTDDMYRLIPVVMLLEKSNDDDELLCEKLGTESMLIPTLTKDWLETGKKICAACA